MLRCHAIDVGLVDVDLDLQGIHVDNCTDAGTREATAGRDWRDDLARLRRLGDDHSGKRRPYGAVRKLHFRATQRRLCKLDLPALHLQLRGQRVLLCLRRLQGLTGHEIPIDQVLVSLRITPCLRQLSGVLRLQGLRRQQLRARLGHAGLISRVIESRQHLPHFDVLALFDEYLLDRAGDLRRHRGLTPGGHVTAGLQYRRRALRRTRRDRRGHFHGVALGVPFPIRQRTGKQHQYEHGHRDAQRPGSACTCRRRVALRRIDAQLPQQTALIRTATPVIRIFRHQCDPSAPARKPGSAR